MNNPECIFCKIARGEVKSDILYRDDTVFVIRDIRPKAPTHLLVMPLEHVTSLASPRPGQEAILGHMLTVAGQMAKREKVDVSGYRLIINQGPDSGQEVPHLHLHVLGGKRLGAMG